MIKTAGLCQRSSIGIFYMTDSTKKYYTYILRCADNTLYCGYTTKLEKRVSAHNGGKGAKYTKSRLPAILVYSEEFDNKSDALKREWHIKKMTRQEKLKLLEEAAAK